MLVGKASVTSWGCKRPLLFSCRGNILLYSLWVLLDAYISIGWVHRAPGTLCVNRMQGTGTCMLCVSPLPHTHAPVSHRILRTKYKFKGNIISSRQPQQSIKPVWRHPERRALWDCTGHIPARPDLLWCGIYGRVVSSFLHLDHPALGSQRSPQLSQLRVLSRGKSTWTVVND